MKSQENSGRKWQRIMYFAAAVVAVAALFQGTVNRAMRSRMSIAGVFRSLAFEHSEGRINLTARIPQKDRHSGEERLLLSFAKKIGLSLTEEPRRASFAGREELIYEKMAAGAFSSIKLVRLPAEQEDYLCAEITLRDASAEAAAELKQQMEQAAERLSLTEISTTFSLTGLYSGELPLAMKDRLADEVMEQLCVRISYEHRENDNYTVYGYTAAEEHYLTVGGKKVNVQTAITYDAGADCTEVMIASPIGF